MNQLNVSSSPVDVSQMVRKHHTGCSVLVCDLYFERVAVSLAGCRAKDAKPSFSIVALGTDDQRGPLDKHYECKAESPTQLVDLAYTEAGKSSQKLDLYLPSDKSKVAPLLVWIHGGGWREGDKSGHPLRSLGTE